MSVIFLHTADWQLGKPFASIDDDTKRHRIQQQRIAAVKAMRMHIESTGASFIVVAGDLFDSPQVTKSTVSAACEAIGGLQVPVVAIPGNHDHGGAGSIWEQEFFQRERQQLAPNLHVLLQPEPMILDSAILFPAPLRHRHESTDPTAWIAAAARDTALPAHLPRIVLAHGTIHGFGAMPEDDEEAPTIANWIDLSRLPLDELDYIALGDWHGTKQVGAKAWYSGTPEIDRFPRGEGNDPGHILKVTVARQQAPQVETISSGSFAWRMLDFRFSDDADLDSLQDQLEQLRLQHGSDLLLRLSLEGALGLEASSALEKIIDSWNARLLRLKLDSRIVIAPSEEEITALTQRSQDPLIATVAAKLLDRCHGDTEDAVLARLALRELHLALS